MNRKQNKEKSGYLVKFFMLTMAITMLFGMQISLYSCGALQVPKESTVSFGYKTLSAAGIAYDNGMKAIADLDRRGSLTKEEKQKVLKRAGEYKEAYDFSVDALALYAETGTREDEAFANEVLDEFLALYSRFLDLVFSLTNKEPQQLEGAPENG